MIGYLGPLSVMILAVVYFDVVARSDAPVSRLGPPLLVFAMLGSAG